MLKIAVCDDSLQDCTLFAATVKGLACFRCEQKLRLFQYTSARQLLFRLEDDAALPDILFLDIYMPEMNGMEVARKLRALGLKIPLVFLTTSSEFALESYEVEAFGYLLKPVDAAKLAALIERFIATQQSRKYYVHRKGTVLRKIFYDDIVYVESFDHFLRLHLANGEQLEESGRLNALALSLDDNRFLRTHQSFLVNMSHIVKAGDTFAMDNGQEVLIRKKDRRAICDQYHRWLIGEAF